LFAVLKDEHFDFVENALILESLLDPPLLLVARVLAELLSSERVLVKIVLVIDVCGVALHVVVYVTILALNADHLAVFLQVNFQFFKREFIKAPTEAAEGVPRALAALDVLLQLADGVDFERVLRLRAAMADFNLVEDVFHYVRLDVSEGVRVLALAVHAEWHVSALGLLILY